MRKRKMDKESEWTGTEKKEKEVETKGNSAEWMERRAVK